MEKYGILPIKVGILEGKKICSNILSKGEDFSRVHALVFNLGIAL